MKLKLIRPVNKKYLVSSPFGMRMHPIEKIMKLHGGIDFACPEGTEVRAVKEGKIIRAGWQDDTNHSIGFGLRVIQEIYCKDDHYYIYYAHLSNLRCYEGQFIDAAGLIGYSGCTGSSTGAHLHLENRLKDTGQKFDMEFEDDEIRQDSDGTALV